MSEQPPRASGSDAPPPDETDGGPNDDAEDAEDAEDSDGSAVKKWATRFVVALVALVGLVVVLYLLGVIGVPTAGVDDRGDWGEVTEDRTEIVTTVWVDNPNPVGISLGNSVGVDYDIRMNDVLLAEGEKSDITVPAGNTTRELRTDLYNDRLNEWWAGFITADETIHLRANANVSYDLLVSGTQPFEVTEPMLQNETPVIDAFSQSINESTGTYTENVSADSVDSGALEGTGLDGSDATLTVGYEVERGWATWEGANASTTTMQVHMLVHNAGDVALPAEPSGVGFSTEANGVEMFTADSGALSSETAGEDPLIQPGETREVTFSLTMDNDNIDDWFTSHVRNDELTRLSTQFQVVFEEPTTGTTFRVPDESVATRDCEFQTAILVDDTESYTTCGSSEEPAAP